MSISLTVEEFIRQRLGDRDLRDYFPGDRELEGIIWRNVACRCNPISVTLTALEIRATPLPTPGDVYTGSFWAYCQSPYNSGIYGSMLQTCYCDTTIDQPSHIYCLFQANAYIDGVYASPQPEIDEISLLAQFNTVVSGTVTLIGYVVNLSRLMHDVFMSIANDLGKLAIYQSTVGGTTDLSQAAVQARREAGNWLRGTMIYCPPLRGTRR